MKLKFDMYLKLNDFLVIQFNTLFLFNRDAGAMGGFFRPLPKNFIEKIKKQQETASKGHNRTQLFNPQLN